MMLQSSPVIAEQGPLRRSWRELFRRQFAAAGRLIVIAALAFWIGGFTFYSGVAIPMGVEVLGTHRRVGFITQRVTNWLNVAGVVALSIFLTHLLSLWRHISRGLRLTLLVTWLLMAAIEIELIALHPVMDRLIGTLRPTPDSVPVNTILDEDRFDALHHVYLISTSVQWGIAMIHVWCICLAWTGARQSLLPASNIALAKGS